MLKPMSIYTKNRNKYISSYNVGWGGPAILFFLKPMLLRSDFAMLFPRVQETESLTPWRDV